MLVSYRLKFIGPISLVLLLFLIFPVAAQRTTQENRKESKQSLPVIDLRDGVIFEISPHTGFMGSSGIFGLRLSMNYNSFNFELAGEQVIGKTANLYPISLNAVLNLATKGRAIPYGVLGGGLFITVPNNTIGDETVSSIGLNFGGGIRYYLNKTIGFRFEAKQYFTNIESEREPTDELLIFQEVSLGITFIFR